MPHARLTPVCARIHPPRAAVAAVLCLLLVAPGAALAYIGPGAGISLLGSVVGVVVTILVAIGAILLWPLRRMMKKRRQAQGLESGETPADKALQQATEDAPAPEEPR